MQSKVLVSIHCAFYVSVLYQHVYVCFDIFVFVIVIWYIIVHAFYYVMCDLIQNCR